MSTQEGAPRFELGHFERSDSGATTHLVLSGRFIEDHAHWLAHTAVLVVKRDGEEVARVAPQSDSSTATTIEDGVHWWVSFAVRKSALADTITDTDAEGTRFEIAAEGTQPIALPAPLRVSRPLMVGGPASERAAASAGLTARASARAGRSGWARLRSRAQRRLHEAPRPARLAAACSLAAGLVAGVGVLTASHDYQATALVLVTPLRAADANYSGLPVLHSSGDSAAVLKTAAAILGQPSVTALTARDMGPQWSPTRVNSHVLVVADPAANLLDVKATGSSAAQAIRLANVFTANALALRRAQLQPAIASQLAHAQAGLRSLGPATTRASAAAATRVAALLALRGTGDPTIRAARQATVGSRQGPTRDAELVLLALIAGALLGLGGDWFADRLGRRAVRDERRLAKLTKVPILARFPAGWRSAGLEDAWNAPELQRLVTLLELGRSAPETIAVVSPDAGDGKTTVATALAVHLARRRESVALLDLDWRTLDAQRRLGVSHAAAASSRGSSGNNHPLLPAAGARSLLVGAVGSVSSAELSATVTRTLSITDRVVVDTPSLSMSRDALSAAVAVEAVLVVVALERTSEHDLIETLQSLLRAGVRPTGILLFGAAGSRVSRTRSARASRPLPRGTKPQRAGSV